MIRTLTKFLVPGVAALAMTPAAFADGRTPGSVLVYPIHRSQFGPATNGPFFTAISVTNTNTQPVTPINGLGGTTGIHWEYVNVIPDPNNPPNNNLPLDCQVINIVEFLTPADTRTVLSNCHNASGGQEGYLVISALDPNSFNVPWSHNWLVGSEVVLSGTGGFYSTNAIPFDAVAEGGGATDADGDNQLDFDGIEYEGIPDELYLDVFFGIDDASSLTLINMTGGFQHTANVRFDVFNDNEGILSATLAFKCWIEEAISDIALVFSGPFLAANTQHDPLEFNYDCMGSTIETGWARVGRANSGANASSSTESIPDPALLGAITAGPGMGIDGGHLLWESKAKQFNGDFYKTGTDDPEFP